MNRCSALNLSSDLPDLDGTARLKDRKGFIGGSDARMIMGGNEATLLRLWQEKRGEIEPEDLSANLSVQLGLVTESLNRSWYERNSGHRVSSVQSRIQHAKHQWMRATLDGFVESRNAVFEAKLMLPWSFSETAAADKHMAQLQHNMLVAAAPTAILSIITGGGQWVEIAIDADPIYQMILVAAERAFWRCILTGDAPCVSIVEAPRPRIAAIRVVDMSTSNEWGDAAHRFRATREAFVAHEKAKADLKSLIPDDASETFGHGVRARRSKAGAITFQMIERVVDDAPVQ